MFSVSSGNIISSNMPGVARRQLTFFGNVHRKQTKKGAPAFVVFVAITLRQKFPALLANAGRCGTRFAE
jgi:hypothetical protein